MGTDIHVVIARPINGHEVYGSEEYTAELVCPVKYISRNYEFFAQLAGVRDEPTSNAGQIIAPVTHKITQAGWPKGFGLMAPYNHGAEHGLRHCSAADWRLAIARSVANSRPVCYTTELVGDIADAITKRFGVEAIICFGFDC